MLLSRRRLLVSAAAAGALPAGLAVAGAPPRRGGQVVIGQIADPTLLTSALSSEGPAQLPSTKIFDGLLAYDRDRRPVPQLATAWEVAADSLSIRFSLRPGVRWHDGRPFTSADVAFTALEAWRRFHSRGRSTFAPLVAVDTPDPLTAIFRLSQPAPYLLSALSAAEAQILPRHLYAGTDLLTNPRNLAPIGTGPFRFAGWERGRFILLERNPDYWDQPKPYLDRIIIRTLPDPATQSVALETGEVDIAQAVPLGDVAHLRQLETLQVDGPAENSATYHGLVFNLDTPALQDVRVRRAFAHAIDVGFIRDKIYFGHGTAGTGPIPSRITGFYSPDVPRYAPDLARAAALLDEAGLKPDASGRRLSLVFVPQPNSEQFIRTAEFIRATLRRIGVELQVQNQDFGAFVRRVYTERKFDVTMYAGQAGPDPAIGTQRIYWSKNFQPGVPFSNGAHYASAEADRLLEAAQVELDPDRRRALYADFQRVVQTDLPLLPLVAPEQPVLVNRRLQSYRTTADGLLGNFAEAHVVSA